MQVDLLRFYDTTMYIQIPSRFSTRSEYYVLQYKWRFLIGRLLDLHSQAR